MWPLTSRFSLTIAGLALACVAMSAAQRAGATALCDAAAMRVRAAADVSTGARTVWSLLTGGTSPFLQVADLSEIALGPNPNPDDRVEFEKRIRARYGNAEQVLKDLRSWDNFEIFALPGSRIRMLLSTGGTAQCEYRYFFQVTTSRDVVHLPDPPAKSSSDIANAICNNLGGWGYFARVNGSEAFVEYHVLAEEESLRVVPLADAEWQPACTVTAKFQTSAGTAKRDRLQDVTVVASK